MEQYVLKRPLFSRPKLTLLDAQAIIGDDVNLEDLENIKDGQTHRAKLNVIIANDTTGQAGRGGSGGRGGHSASRGGRGGSHMGTGVLRHGANRTMMTDEKAQQLEDYLR